MPRNKKSKKAQEIIEENNRKKLEKAQQMMKQYWHHISIGDMKGESPTGFHWTGNADNARHKQVGSANTPDEYGVYQQYIQPKKDKRKNKKPKISTFFPDDWEEQDFQDAFAALNELKQITSDTQSGKKANGMVLTIKGDGTCFPVYQGNEDDLPIPY